MRKEMYRMLALLYMEAMKECGMSVTELCQSAHVSRTTFYKLRGACA